MTCPSRVVTLVFALVRGHCRRRPRAGPNGVYRRRGNRRQRRHSARCHRVALRVNGSSVALQTRDDGCRAARIASIACRLARTTPEVRAAGLQDRGTNRHSASTRVHGDGERQAGSGQRSPRTVTVTGESPTVDTKSNLQQTVHDPGHSGRRADRAGIRGPLAKLVAGLARCPRTTSVARSRCSRAVFRLTDRAVADVSFNIDGATVNWPGGGGGSTMMSYDQGMFEEMNYMTSGFPRK